MYSCERLTISTLDSLWCVKVVAFKLDSLGKLTLRRWCRSDHLWEILNNKVHVLVLLRQVDADEAMATSDIHEGAAHDVVKVAHVVIIEEVLNLIALSASKRRHGTTEALSTNWILTKSREHWLFRAESDLETTLVVLLAAWEFLQRLDGGSGRLSRVSSLCSRSSKRRGGAAHWRHILGAEA